MLILWDRLRLQRNQAIRMFAIEAMITGGNGRFADASGTFTVNVQVEEATGNVEGNFEGLISQP